MREVTPRYGTLFQINTRVWLTELSRALRRRATLDDIPDAELNRLAHRGFDWIWMLSVWQRGSGAQHVSRGNDEWRKEFTQTLPDLQEDDIAGSGFAVSGYAPDSPSPDTRCIETCVEMRRSHASATDCGSVA